MIIETCYYWKQKGKVDHWNTPTETLRMECQGGHDKPGLFAISIIPTGWKSFLKQKFKDLR